MNRVDFMNQLERLLQSIPTTEREEAIQYYNDYFDDAGAENEQEVIEALGNPARVAENIKRDLAGTGDGEAARQKVKASDRVLMEYGKEIPDDSEDKKENGQADGGAADRFNQKMQETQTNKASGQQSGGYSSSWQDSSNAATGYEGGKSDPFAEYGSSSRYSSGGGSGSWEQDTSGYSGYEPEKHKKGDGMPVWALAMLITVLVIASPVIFGVAVGILGAVFGVLAGWFALIFGFGVSSVVLLGVMVLLVAVGIMCFFASPWVGITLVGGGLVCGSVGILLLMATVAMAGIITPAVFRGIAFVFRGFRRKRKKAY